MYYVSANRGNNANEQDRLTLPLPPRDDVAAEIDLHESEDSSLDSVA